MKRCLLLHSSLKKLHPFHCSRIGALSASGLHVQLFFLGSFFFFFLRTPFFNSTPTVHDRSKSVRYRKRHLHTRASRGCQPGTIVHACESAVYILLELEENMCAISQWLVVRLSPNPWCPMSPLQVSAQSPTVPVLTSCQAPQCPVRITDELRQNELSANNPSSEGMSSALVATDCPPPLTLVPACKKTDLHHWRALSCAH